MNLIFLDTETTGNEPATDRLCQVCYRVGKETKTEYFKPSLPMSVKAMSITHITNQMLEDKPAFAESQMKKDLEFLLAGGVMVAHNAIFDKAILEAEGVVVPRFICTLRVARALDTKDAIAEYNLQFLRYYLDLKVEGNPHDAEGDVNVLEALFGRLFAKVREETKSDEEAIEKMIAISNTPVLFRKFNFGKYKDKAIDEVIKTDGGYLEWLLSEKQKTPEAEQDWIYTLNTYLNK
jgi:DNA polymerase III alpha subunit (gram-positive type)